MRLTSPKLSMELASTRAIKRALTSGHGYALLSSYVVKEELSRSEPRLPEVTVSDLDCSPNFCAQHIFVNAVTTQNKLI